MQFNALLAMKLFSVVTLVTSTNVLYTIPEHSAKGTLVGNIAESISLVRLVSQASLPYMKYSFLSIDSNLRKYFTLDDKTGDLMLSSTETLDRETVCQFDVTCVLYLQIAIQSTHTQFFRKVLVSIDVLDINDHAPNFKENSTLLTISESIQIPNSFPLPSAADKDTGVNNSLQGYEIFPKDTPFELLYSRSNPNLMLRVSRELDHEARDFYGFKIIARDGGSPPKEGVLYLDITVEDVNDNAPIFTQENYAKVVDETVGQGSLLFTVTATDADSGRNGQVRYRLSPEQPPSIMSMFSLNEVNGDLRLVGDLQNADTELYKLDVEASDLAEQPFTTKTTASIQIEDTINSRPKLLVSYLSTNNYSSISEYANIGVAVAHILVRDTDRGPNGIVQCKLNTPSFFELQNYDVKEYNIIVAKPLDWEFTRLHNVTVECSDAGQPSLTVLESIQVKVIDENDNAPEFKNRIYNVTLRENNESNKEILKVLAVDADDVSTGNGRVTYSLQDTSNDEFRINTDTGVITATTSFDYEVRRQINFTVVAEDNGNPRRFTKAAIIVNIVDENDQVPYFTQSRFTIVVSEYARPGDLIGEIKAFDFEDGVNGQFEMFMILGSGKGKNDQKSTSSENVNLSNKSLINYEKISDEKFPLLVRPNGSLVLTGDIDHEAVTSYEFQVRSTDKGEPPLSDIATVVIGVKDENDNSPHIVYPNVSDISFQALVGNDAPLIVVELEAMDRDSGRNGFLVYTITARNDSGKFQIDSEGRIKRTRVLGNKDAGTYKLSVVVMDSGSPPLSDVVTFFIHVAGGNDTLGRSGALSDQYIIITLTLVCVTILLSVTVILVIVIMKRLDRRRKSHPSCSLESPLHIHNSRVISFEPSKAGKLRNSSDDSQLKNDDNGHSKKMNDTNFGFPSLSENINTNCPGDRGCKLETSRFQYVKSLTQVVANLHEDGVSDSSGDTSATDSGRGASDEDISMSNPLVGDLHGCSLVCKNGNLQLDNIILGQKISPKSESRIPTRYSQRKHVTFKDVKQMTNRIGGLPELCSPYGEDAAASNAEDHQHHQSINTFNEINSAKKNTSSDTPMTIRNENIKINTFKSSPEHAQESSRITLLTFN